MTRSATPYSRRSARSRGGDRTGRRHTAAGQHDFAVPAARTPSLSAASTFAELDMPPALLRVLADHGVVAPFPIQGATLPDALNGRDVLGRGRTGSGKTLAFGLALLSRTAGRRAQPRRPRALILVPTRELAQQVTDALLPYAGALGVRLVTVVGGMSLNRQSGELGRGAEVVVATPGRLADLIDRGDCHLDQVQVTVLDEADQMADMGFLPQVTVLLDQVAPGGQRMLFSATLDRNVDRLVRRFLTDPVTHSVDPATATVAGMHHHLLQVTDADKPDTVTHIAAREGRVILFVGMKHAADRLAKRLLASGVQAAALHGGKSQAQRNRTLEHFRNGSVTALVATNLAARGIHIDGLDLVVNVDPPTDHKDYLHRGGRTARAGEPGTVVTLVLPGQYREMQQLMSVADISADSTHVRSGDAELARITGARPPTGVPVVPAALPADRTSNSRASSGRNRSGRARRNPRTRARRAT